MMQCKKDIYIFVIIIFICQSLFIYINAYIIAKRLQNKIILQYESGYLDYLDEINAGTVYNDKIEDEYGMLNDSIKMCIKGKESLKKDNISAEDLDLRIDHLDTFIIPKLHNKIYMHFSFEETVYFNNNSSVYLIGDKGRYYITLEKVGKEWQIESIKRNIFEPYSYA